MTLAVSFIKHSKPKAKVYTLTDIENLTLLIKMVVII